jgi:hypothetical protein
MSESPREKPKHVDRGRMNGAIIYLLSGLILVVCCLCFWRDLFFYDAARAGFANWPRFIWCLNWSVLGFSAIAYRASKGKHDVGAIPSYILLYPLTLLFLSSLLFAFVHTIPATSTYLFYFFTAPIAFTLSFKIDAVHKEPLAWLLKIVGLRHG